jgi:hypothetical protein
VRNMYPQGKWDPSYFIERYGEQIVDLHDCETRSTCKSTITAFFQSFGKPRDGGQILKLKVSPVVCAPFTFVHSYHVGLAFRGASQQGMSRAFQRLHGCCSVPRHDPIGWDVQSRHPFP